jgi:hypothetical protein
MAGEERAERLAKIRPEYATGEIVLLTSVAGRAEAELIHNLLLEEGIPSEVRPSTIASALQAAQMPMVSYSVFVRESGLEQARFALALDEEGGLG